MKIYTKTGDSGKTSLFGGKRVPKSALRIDTYGTVDELNCAIGLCRALGTREMMDSFLGRVQSDLFRVGAELSIGGESQPSGLVPVVPRLSGIEEVASECADTVFFTPDSPESLAGCLERLAADPAALEQLSAAGRIKARSFAWGPLVRRIADITTDETHP